MQCVSFTTESRFFLVNFEKAMCFKNYEEPAWFPLPLIKAKES